MIGNAIGTFFQRKKGKGVGPLPPIPDLEGVIGLYIAKGLTNDSMKENPVWKDMSGLGNDLQMKNFSWSLGSGCGLYTQNYNEWRGITGYAEFTQTSSSIHITNIGNGSLNIYYQLPINIPSFTIPTYKIKVSGLKENEYISYRSPNKIYKSITKNGIYELPSLEFEKFDKRYGFSFNIPTNSCDITIEEIPNYQGAIVFDGINDYGICETFSIVTKEKGYTVMALRKWLTYPLAASATLASKRKDASLGAFIMERNISVSEPEVSYTFGQRSGISIDNNNLVTYQTTNYYNDQKLQVGNSEDTDTLLLGAGFYNNGLPSGYGNFAAYSVVIIDHDTTEAERQLILDYWKQEYPELFFDQAWTVTGLTNDSPDKATIKNLTGNGVDLTLNNFAFAGNSGYGWYIWDFELWQGRNNKPSSNSVSKLNLVGSVDEGIWGYYINKFAGEDEPIKLTVKVTGLTTEMPTLYFGEYDHVDTSKLIEIVEGVNVIDTIISSTVTRYGFGFRTAVESCDITIEQIPDYSGYLVTDGVESYATSPNFNLYDDFTFVGEWILLSTDVSVNAGIVKASKLYIYNDITGISLFINGTGATANTGLRGIKSLKAICSDGRAYDENWNEIIVKFDVHGRENNSLILGSNTNNNKFTSLVFKNGAFYSDRLLTKKQCIAGYNLLQTFKNS